MSTINSEQYRFLWICIGLGCVGTIPFIMHPLGYERPDAWMYSSINYIAPMVLLLRFQPKQRMRLTATFVKNFVIVGLMCEAMLIVLLILSIILNHLHVDWSFAGFKGWVEIQIGQQIETTQAPMPGIPQDFQEISKWAFWSSFTLPWVLWWGALPQELVWRGWLAQHKPHIREWIVLSSFWTLWQLPSVLMVQEWHLGWWVNNGEVFVQQVLSTWLLGILLVGLRQQTNSTIISALIISLLTISQVWPIMLQDFSPAPNWTWIGWNGWLGCALMVVLIHYLSNNRPTGAPEGFH